MSMEPEIQRSCFELSFMFTNDNTTFSFFLKVSQIFYSFRIERYLTKIKHVERYKQVCTAVFGSLFLL